MPGRLRCERRSATVGERATLFAGAAEVSERGFQVSRLICVTIQSTIAQSMEESRSVTRGGQGDRSVSISLYKEACN